jgi:alpha-tubulin suppressor-like RCC1 family protein
MNCLRHILFAVALCLAAVLPAVEPQVVTGNQHALYLADDGTVWAWGRNSEGQLGLGDMTPRLEPVQVPGLTNIVQVSAGLYHSMALKADGTVYAWGYNYYGQVGNGGSGTSVGVTSPYALSLSNVKQIAAGGYHCLALLTDGTARGWGLNLYGEVGNGSSVTTSPYAVTSPATVSTSVKFRSICGGGLHSLAIRDDGTAWAWGYDGYGELGNDSSLISQSSPVQVSGLTNVMSLGAGYLFSMAVTTSGSAYVWGDNSAGQLCNGTSTGTQATPISAPGAVCSRPATGYQSVMLLRSNGYPSFWGANGSGQCRQSSSTNPVTSLYSPGVPVRTASSGFGDFFVAINGDGSVISWGDNSAGQLGINSTSPSNSYTPFTVHATWPVSKPMAVLRGQHNTAALKSDGTVWAWGYGANGQMGNGTTTTSYAPVQASVSGITTLSGGGDYGDHVMALTYNGQVYAWGRNDSGQTGDGTTTTPRSTPGFVSGSNGWRGVAAGDYHSLAIDSNGYVKSWGGNAYGQLGDGTTTTQTSPVLVPSSSLANVLQVAAGTYYSAALRADGTVWTWGNGGYGQLGNNTTTASQLTPVQVSSLTGVIQICAGSYHMLALKSDGTVVAWGLNGSYQLGDASTTTHTTYVSVVGEGLITTLTNIRSLGAGRYSSFAVTGSGGVRSWGDDSNGMLGDGGSANVTRPTAFTTATSALMIDSGYLGTVALLADGSVQAWGYNGNGQIGNGTTVGSSTPTSTTPNWLPTISADAASSSLTASETGPTAGTVRFVRTGSTAGSQVVAYGTSGTATAGSDYTTGTTVIIPWSQTGANATVTPVDDFMVDPAETVVVTASSSASSYFVGSPASATITITDNDTAGITVSPTALTTTEAGGSATFTITLTSQPVANVTIGLTNNDPTEGSLSTTSVVLTSSNWNTGVTVTVMGVDDSIDDGDVSYTITTNAAVSSDANYSGLNAADVTVTNIDNDTAGFEFQAINGNPTEAVGGIAAVAFTSFTSSTKTLILPGTVDVSGLRVGQSLVFLNGTNSGQGTTITSITAGSGGSAHTLVLASSLSGNDLGGGTLSFIPCFGIRLTSQPTADVVLACSSADTGKLGVSPTSLTFTSANWNIYQLVSCYGIDNKLDDGDVIVKARFDAATSSDSVYSGMKPNGVNVTVIDDDVSALVVSQSSVALTEGGSATTYTVKLACRPTAAVTVGITNGNPTRVSVDKTSLTFGILTWNVAQTVTVAAVNDFDINGIGSATITHAVTSSSDANYAAAPNVAVSATVTDNDVPAIVVTPVTSSSNRLIVNEGAAVTVGVRLAARPDAGKSVRLVFSLSASASGHDTISTNDLTWNSTTWNSVQYVTITADEDDLDTTDEQIELYMDVVSTGASDDPHFYDFSSYAGWTAHQTNVSFVQNLDNDKPGIKLALATGSLVLNEGGTSGTVHVRLTTDPGENGTVTPTDGLVVAVALSGTDVTVSPSILFFTSGSSGNYATVQDVEVTAVDDKVAQGAHSGVLQATITYSTSAKYPIPPAVTSPTSSLAIPVADDDSIGVVVSPTEGLLCTEAGGSSVFTVRLTSQPTNTVRVAFARSSAVVTLDTSTQTGGGSDVTDHSSAWIDFTPTTWSTTRTVSLAGVDNSTADGDKDFDIVVTIDGTHTTDTTGYATLDPTDVRGSTIDNDSVGMHLWADATSTTAVGTLSLTEASGGSHTATYYVSLASQPSATVTVSLYSDGQTAVSPSSLVFDASTWSVRQAVTVTAVDDAMAESSPHTGIITAGATGGDYTGVAISSVVASITDNDTAGITVGTVSGPVVESGAMLVGPVAAVTGSTAGTIMTVADASGLEVGMWLKITSGGDSGRYAKISALSGTTVTLAATLGTAALVTAETYRTTITASDVTGAVVTLPASIPVSGLVIGQYLQFIGGANNGRTAQITAIDVSGHTVTVSAAMTTTTNQNLRFFAALSVVLLSRPTAPVDVAVGTSDSGKAEAFPGHLTFTAQNWNVPQIIAVQGVDNVVDDGDQSPSVTFSTATSTDGNYSGRTLPSRTVTVLDDDEHGIVLSSAAVSVDEDGGTSTITVRLASQPTADVTVTLTPASGSVTTDPTVLTFSSSTWQTDQTVTVTGQDNGTDPGAGISTTVALSAASTDTTYNVTTASLAVTVTAVNAAPIIDAITDQVATQQNSQIVVPLTGIGSGQTGESQTLTVTATASPATLLGTPVVTYASPGATGSVTIPLVSGAFGAGTVTITVADDASIDGTTRSTQVSFAVTVAAVVVDLNGADPGINAPGRTFTENDTGVVLASGASVIDSQGSNLASLDVVIDATPDGVDESLAVDMTGTGLSGSYDAGTRTLTITGSATAAVYQQVVRTLAYHHAGEDPTAGDRTVTLQATDQDGVTSLSAAVVVTVVPVNDAPVIAGSGTLSVSGQQSIVIDTSILTVTDVDTPSSSLSVTAVTIPGEGALLLNGVALETGASVTLAQISAGELVYQHTSVTLSNDVFAVRASDGSAASALSLVTITVLGSHAPTMAATTVAVAGNHPRTVTLPISDPVGLMVTVALSSSAPPAKGKVTVVTGTNQITYEPDIDATGDDAFGLVLTNTNNEKATVTVNVHITDPSEDQPMIVSLPPVEVVVGERFYYAPVVTNSLGGTLVWELETVPSGVNFTNIDHTVNRSTTGTINWPSVPMPSDGSGYHRLDLVAVDDTNHRVAWQVIWLKVRATAPTVAN